MIESRESPDAPADSSLRARGSLPSRPVLAALTLAMVALVGSTIVGEVAGAGDGPARWLIALDVIVGVVGCAAMPLVFGWPLHGAVALALLGALSPAATPLAATAILWLAQRRRTAIAVGVAATAVAAQVTRGFWRPVSGLTLGWWFVLVAAGFAAVVGWGAMMRARRELITALTDRATRAETEQSTRVAEARRSERTAIAREMHDVLAHRLSLIATYAGALEFRPDAPAEQRQQAAEVIRSGAHLALEELREVIGVLRDDRDHAGVDGERPQPTLADVVRLLEESRAAGMAVELTDQVADPTSVPAGTGRTVYRIVQEALTNARKHAPGQQVRVSLAGEAGRGLAVDVVNARSSAPAGVVTPGSGTGLVGLGERVRVAGGQIHFGPTPAGDFAVHAEIPWPA